jgi:hypothetical protein
MGKWKMDGDSITVDNGNPVWIYDDGRESGFNAESALKSISDVTAESMARKEKIRGFEAQLEVFKDIENPGEYLAQAKAAMETLSSLDQKKLMDAGEVDVLKKSIEATYKEKINGMETAFGAKEKEYKETLNSQNNSISNMLIEGEIGRSGFISDKTVLTPSIAFSAFKNNFKVKEIEGRPFAIASRQDGTAIMSLKDPGKYASVNEALETLVNEHPDKSSLLKGISGGGGTPPGGPGGITHTDYQNMSPIERLNASRGVTE